ncbi:MAG: hypothetical protein D6732_27145 [Methanobacteriota archaeon]|nr:MAG: hypothetical protein D6732_27145 [Euryarchaeota archaeon]
MVMLLLMTTGVFSQDNRAGDPDDTRSGKDVKLNTQKVVKVQKDGKIIVVTTHNNRTLTKQAQRKLAQIREARAKAIPQNANRKMTVKKATSSQRKGKARSR